MKRSFTLVCYTVHAGYILGALYTFLVFLTHKNQTNALDIESPTFRKLGDVFPCPPHD